MKDNTLLGIKLSSDGKKKVKDIKKSLSESIKILDKINDKLNENSC